MGLENKDNKKRNFKNDRIIKARRNGRKFAIQAIYQWQVNNNSDFSQLEVQFKTSNSYIKHVDWDLFELLVKGVMYNKDSLDDLFKGFLPGNLDQVNLVERAILRVGCFELKNCLDTPYKVIISEYVDLANDFGAEKGEKFVNSILDLVSKSVRG